MSGNQTQKIAAAEGKRLGLPEDMKVWQAHPFEGINQQDARTAIKDAEFYWLENFIQTGKATLRSLWDSGPPLFTIPGTALIVYFSWFNLGANYYCAVFLGDGTAIQVAYPSGTTTWISETIGTFYTPEHGQLPFAQQSGEQALLICNNLTANSYWVWDGTILYGAGTLGPFQLSSITSGGAGYTSAPTVTFYGGAGISATGVGVIYDGAMVGVTITNPGQGYVASDTDIQMAVSGGGSNNGLSCYAVLTATIVNNLILISGGGAYTTVPTVSFTGGGGSGASAVATISGGSVTGLTLVTTGSGYTGTPFVSFSGGGGAGATATAVLASSTVNGVAISNGGTGYSVAPTLTFVGGGGAGAAATATITGGVVTSISVTTHGSGYTSCPAVVVAPGANSAAYGSIMAMPYGVSGTTIETYLSRVWLANTAQTGTLPTGGTILTSVAGSLTDFATSDGGNAFTSSDRWLRVNFVGLHQSNGYLYPIADSSVSVISNVQTSGVPTATTYNYYNMSAQVGASWRDTIQDFGQSIVFANNNGIQVIYGGVVRQASMKMQNVFADAVYPAAGGLTPSAAVNTFLTIPLYCLLMTITDPFTNLPRNAMIVWDEKQWYVASQATAVTFIATQEISSDLNAWGTDGTNLVQLFYAPSTAITKIIATKYFASEREFIIKEPLAVYLRATDVSSAQSGVSLTVNMLGVGIAQQIGQLSQLSSMIYPLTVQPNFYAPRFTEPVWAGAAPSVAGTALGVNITSTSPDFIITGLSVAFTDIAPLFG